MVVCISQTLPEDVTGPPGKPVSAAFPDSWHAPGMAYGVYPLAGGHYDCPRCGGTCHYFDRAVTWALREGYRHIDTAQHYQNEGRGSEPRSLQWEGRFVAEAHMALLLE